MSSNLHRRTVSSYVSVLKIGQGSVRRARLVMYRTAGSAVFSDCFLECRLPEKNCNGLGCFNLHEFCYLVMTKTQVDQNSCESVRLLKGYRAFHG